MVQIINFTPFANLRFSNRTSDGREFGVFMAKTALDIGPDGSCSFSTEQEPFVFTDAYHGDMNISSVRYPSDFVPYKPHTDIILDATAYAPNGRPAPEWQVSVKVSDALGSFANYAITVTGPRQWHPVWLRDLDDQEKSDWRRHQARGLFRGWKLSSAQPIDRLPIRYEYAFGGLLDKGFDEDGRPIHDAFEYNPIGPGQVDPQLTDHTQPVDAPQIVALDSVLQDPFAAHSVEGFGPIPPAWLPRRAFGGTYDDFWSEHIWPNWAPDYDYRFHNAAHPNLQGSRFLEGEIQIELGNLHPVIPNFTVRLPGQQLMAAAIGPDGSEKMLKMALDTVFLEIGEAHRDDPRIYCIWRTPFDLSSTDVLALMRADDLESQVGQRMKPDEVACDPTLLDTDIEEEAV